MMQKQVAAALVLALIAAGCAKSGAVAPQDKAGSGTQTQDSAQSQPAAETKESLNDQAFAQIQAKNWDEAIKLAARAVALDAAYGPAQFNLGLAYYRAGKYAEARPHLEAAYQLNQAQVEPGWFYALTLEELKQPADAMTVLKDLQARFPGDAEVPQAIARLQATAPEAGPLVWKRLPEATLFAFLGDRMVQVPSLGRSVQGTDRDGKVLWELKLDAWVNALIAHPSGRMALAVMAGGDAAFVDTATGKLLAKVSLGKFEDPGGKGAYFVWQGDMLYVGDDRWTGTLTGGRYAFTVWTAYRVSEAGGQVTLTKAASFEGRQSLAVSPDGHTVLTWWPAVGQSADLYVDGQKKAHFEQASGLMAGGAGVWFARYDGTYATFGLDGKPTLTGRAPAGAPDLDYWPRPDGTWFVASQKPNDGYVLLNGTEATSPKLQGKVIATTARALVVNMGQELHVLNTSGKTMLAVPAQFAQVTPDGLWLYVTTRTDVTAYRLP
jgi:tetratricopeptide (TPR) repeat protein